MNEVSKVKRTGKPAPAKHAKCGRPNKYPLADMRPGDYFDVTVPADEDLDAAAGRIRGAVATWRQRHARGRLSFFVRITDDEKRVVTVWAVEPKKG